MSALLAVHPTLPVRTVKEFVALAKKQPGGITTASPGTSSIAHLALELFMHTAGVKLLHVPYKGGGPAAVDALAGQVLSIMSISSTTAPHVQSGRLRGLGITSAKRSPILPNVPTIAESGYPGFEASGWLGLLVPAKTPPAIVERLYKETAAVLNTPAVREQLEKGNYDVSWQGVSPHTPASLLKTWAAELDMPVIPPNLYNEFMEHSTDLEHLTNLVHNCLPPQNRQVRTH